MAFQIEIVKVDVESKGKYRIAAVAHKTADGKVDSKKIVSFAFPEVFKAVADAKQGDLFEVESKKIKNEKDGKDYWQWVAVSSVGKSTGQTVSKVASVVRSNYETPEERAHRQVYIVRQSSIANAIAYFAEQPGTKFSVDEVVEVAQQFEAYVFGNSPDKGNIPILPSEVS